MINKFKRCEYSVSQKPSTSIILLIIKSVPIKNKKKTFKLHKELAVEEHLQTQIVGRWGQNLRLKIGRQAGMRAHI